MKRIISIILLIVILLSYMQTIVNAVEINSAYIENLGDCGQHLQFFDSNTGTWSYVITEMAGYRDKGTIHYAYCLEVDKKGVGKAGNYTVNISEMLSDISVWRAIINGFPYKSSNELEVDNDQDAFVATKQAVYSVLYNRDVNTYYRGGDERGGKIVNAIRKIVNNARGGSETPKVNNLINADKVGYFKKDLNDYYSQEYSISSSTEISGYSVTSLNDFPEGSFVSDLNNNVKSEFSAGEHFKVLIPRKNIKNDFNGKINIKGNVKTYPVFFGKSPDENWQNYALTYYAYTDASTEVTLSINTNKSELRIIKSDSETNQKLEGVEFELKYKNGDYIGKYKTDKNGLIEIKNLKPGIIIAKEIKTLEEYVYNNEIQEIDLLYDDTRTIDIQNDHKKGNLKVYKVDSKNKKVTLGGVEFDLYSYELKKVIGTYLTDANGEINIESLRTGNWALIEKKTNKWYNLSDSVDIKVEWNETSNATIENELKKGQVKVIKVDKENNEIKLANVTFQVMDENGNVLENLVTNQEGEALTSSYAVRDYPKLYFKEIATNENYELNETINVVELKENEIVNVIFENERKVLQKKLPKTGF